MLPVTSDFPPLHCITFILDECKFVDRRDRWNKKVCYAYNSPAAWL